MCTIAKVLTPLKTEAKCVAQRDHKAKTIVEFDQDIIRLIRRA